LGRGESSQQDFKNTDKHARGTAHQPHPAESPIRRDGVSCCVRAPRPRIASIHSHSYQSRSGAWGVSF